LRKKLTQIIKIDKNINKQSNEEEIEEESVNEANSSSLIDLKEEISESKNRAKDCFI
jgi:hypothetical protein